MPSSAKRQKNSKGVWMHHVLVGLLGLAVLVSVGQVYYFHPEATMVNGQAARPVQLDEFVVAYKKQPPESPTNNDSRRPPPPPPAAVYSRKLTEWFRSRNVTLSDDERQKLKRLDWKYGEPRVYGMERCAAYQASVPQHDRIVAVAGMFNTGTNAMEGHLRRNILHIQHKWQVPWGKHRLERVRLSHVAPGMEGVVQENVLPVVMTRDPFQWMQSMCKSPYAAKWKHGKHHCPNLVMTEHDRHVFQHVSNFSVSVVFDKQHTERWDSLVHLYNDWYNQYWEATYPRLLVRFEDVLMHPEMVLGEIARCVNATLPDALHISTDAAKSHGSHTNLLQAILKTSDEGKRLHSLTGDDLDYARTHLDANLMELFGYDIPSKVLATNQIQKE